MRAHLHVNHVAQEEVRITKADGSYLFVRGWVKEDADEVIRQLNDGHNARLTSARAGATNVALCAKLRSQELFVTVQKPNGDLEGQSVNWLLADQGAARIEALAELCLRAKVALLDAGIVGSLTARERGVVVAAIDEALK